MAKLIHSATLANFQTLFPDWKNSTSSVYKSVVFTDDGYICTHGKSYRVALSDDTTQGLTEFIRDGLTTTITVTGVTKSITLPSITTSTSDILTITTPTGTGDFTINHGNKLTAAGSFNSSISNYVLTPKGASYDIYGHIKSVTTGTATHLDYVARTADTATTANTPLFFGNSATGVIHYNTNIYAVPNTGSIGAVTIYENGSSLATKYAGKSAFDTHATTTATASVLGHVKLIDTYNSTNDTTKGLAATPKAVQTAYNNAKAYADGLLAANDAMIFKGTIGSTGATVTTLPTTGYSAGWTYRVITAGTYAGKVCEVGDLIIAVKDGPASGTSVINDDWTVAQTNIDGAVTTSSTLTANTLILGGGNRTITSLANGSTGQILQFNGTAPTWVTANFAREIKVNGTQALAANTSTALNLANGNNISITNSNGTVTIAATGLVKPADLKSLTFANSGTSLGTYNTTAAATLNVSGCLTMAGSSGTYTISHNTSGVTALTTAAVKKLTYDSYGHITGSADPSSLIIKIKSGTVEGTSLYTYNGNNAKTLDIKQGSNITLTAAAGALTIAATDTLYKLIVGGSSATANASTTNGNTYLRLLTTGNKASGSFKISGTGSTTVVSDASGNITIDSTNTWRPVYAWKLSELTGKDDTIDEVLANTTGTNPLRFGSSFAYDSTTNNELELVWLEIDSSGNKTYAI